MHKQFSEYPHGNGDAHLSCPPETPRVLGGGYDTDPPTATNLSDGIEVTASFPSDGAWNIKYIAGGDPAYQVFFDLYAVCASAN